MHDVPASAGAVRERVTVQRTSALVQRMAATEGGSGRMRASGARPKADSARSICGQPVRYGIRSAPTGTGGFALQVGAADGFLSQ